MTDIKIQKPAKRYAEAIFEIIKNKDFNLALNEIKRLVSLIDENKEFKSFLFHPVVLKEDKKAAVKEIFPDFDNEVLNFIFLLIDETRIDCLDEILKFLIEKINEKENLKTVDVTLAIEPDEELKSLIKTRLENKLQSKVIPNFTKDENILGGMVIKIKDTLIDLSVKNKIENLKRI